MITTKITKKEYIIIIITTEITETLRKPQTRNILMKTKNETEEK